MANLKISDLDFDSIKENLKTFLKNYRDSNGDLVFTDYDFSGSALSVLLDLLAYNTHYNGYYANMLMNEMFLDSAVKRESAVSIAKHLGYTPRSVRSARATIGFTVSAPSGNPTSLTLDKYTAFNTIINNVSYTFVNVQPKTIVPVSGVYEFNDVEILEGIPLEYIFRVNNPGPGEKYEIPNENIDTTSLVVTVQNSNTDTTTTTFEFADDVVDINGDSKVYYIEESPTGKFQLIFGDGVLGKKLVNGNLVKVQYLISNGSDCNVSSLITQNFTTSATVGGGGITNIVTSINSNYGANRETITEIKFNAPKFNSSQNRAVTADDYKVLIDTYYPALIDSISVWGGEENIPKKYGKVIIALSPATGFTITEDIKNNISNYLKQKKILSVTPEYVDPEYFYINLMVNVKYNFKLTSLTSDDIKQLVLESINNYFNNNLKRFDQDFVFSKLSKLIDESEDSIVGNLISLKIQKRIIPALSTDLIFSDDDSLKFYVGLLPGSLESTRFAITIENVVYPVIMKDYPTDSLPNYSGAGIIKLINPITNAVVKDSFGTIDYGAGTVSIPTLNVTGFYDDSTDLRIMVAPQNSYLDVTVNRNQILLLDDSTSNPIVNRTKGLDVNVYPVNA